MKKHRKSKLARVEKLATPVPEPQQEVVSSRKKDIKIIGEVTEKREKSIKHFLKEDLTFEAVIYNEPVHYLSDGKWKDIDNSIIETTDEENSNVLENKDNDFKIRIAKNIKNRKLLVVKKDKYETSWGIDGAASVAKVKGDSIPRNKIRQEEVQSIRVENLKKQTLPKLTSTVEFSNVYPNIDLQYSIMSEMVKENIIIKDKVNNPMFTFNIEVKNLIPVLQQDNSIIFYDNENTSEVIFKIDPPIMYDSAMVSSKDIKITLTEQNEIYVLTLIPDNNWINSKDKKFPIVIDPTIKTAQLKNSIFDSYISSNYPNSIYGGDVALKVGKGASSGVTRSFIRFILPTDKLTSADLVIRASLNLNLYLSNYDNRQINVHKVLGAWDSASITWYNVPLVDDTKIQDYQLTNAAAGNWVTWDITRVVKEWLTSGVNYGLMLKNNDESVGYNQFYSSDVGDIDEFGNNLAIARPLITIDYINNSGLENYWTYHSQNVGRAGTGYINDLNGNLVFVHNDLSMNGSKMPLTLNHVFNSNDRDNTFGYGYGWRLNVSQKVDVTTIGDTQFYIYTDEDGTKNYFYYDSSSATYKQQMGTDLTFTKNLDGSYNIKDKNGGTLEFTDTGYLLKIKDKNDNTIALSYDDAILKKITDGAGRVTTLDVISNGYLIGIVDPSGRRTSFAYNGVQLSKITYPDGNYTLFTYDSKNNITKVVNYDGYNIVYNYYTEVPYRVKQVQEFGTDGTAGGSLNIQYGYNTTTFTDNKNRTNIHQFNDYGTTMSIKESDENAEVYKYYNSNRNEKSSENLYNKLNAASRMQKFNKNYLKNHGIEIGTSDWTTDNWENNIVNGSMTTEEAYIGLKSLKINKTSGSSRDYYKQNVILSIGKNYIFSAYIKTADITTANNKGAALFIEYKNTSGVKSTFESMYVQGTSDWSRYEVKFTLPSNTDPNSVYAAVGVIEEKGVAYFDCMQMEEGTLPSRYNIVENADFSYDTQNPVYWEKDQQSDINDKVLDSYGKRSYRILGAQGKQKYIRQTLNISGNAGDVFIASAWAKGNSVPLNDPNLSLDKVRRFSLEVGLEKLGNQGTDWFIISFDEDAIDWQYISNIIVAKNDYGKIFLHGEYYNNSNDVYFTNFQLYKEEYGVSYTYDDKGNAISIKSLAKQESAFKYDGNEDLIEVATPVGGKFKYEYSTEGKRNLIKATSATNVVYSFTYDSSGNPLTSKVGTSEGTSPIFRQSTASYSIGGNYLKAITDSKDNSIISHYNEQKGLLTALTDANGGKTSYKYDDMNRLISAAKILGDTGDRSIEKFPLSLSLVGSKGTKTVFDAGVNLITNSSFENSSNSWSLEDWNSSTGRWRVVSAGVHGNYCLESYDLSGSTSGSATNAVAYQLVTLPAALLSSKAYTLSAYAKKTGTVNPILGMRCFDKNGAEIAGSYLNYEKPIAQDKWVRISNTFTLPTGTKSFFVLLRSAVKGTSTVSFDAVQIEENTVPTTYSLSRSDNSKLSYDLGIDKKSGTMSVWFTTTGTGTRMIFSNESNTALFNLYINSQNNITLGLMNGAGVFQNIISANDITVVNNTWYFVALKWQWSATILPYSSSLNCTLYINNRIYTGAVSDFRDFTGVITVIGSNPYDNYNLLGTLDNFAYSKNPLSYEDIQFLYNKTLPDDKGTTIINSYNYDKDKIVTINHNSFNYKFEYDSLGNNSKVYVESQPLITNNFDASTGNLLNSVYGNQQRVSLEYDTLDRVIARKFNKNVLDSNQTDEIRYTYEYDSNQNLAYHEDKINNKRYRYTYDLSDRVTRVNEFDNINSNNINYTKFAHDKNNNQNRIIQKINGSLYETKYEYDADNKPIAVFYGDGIEDNDQVEYFSLNGTTTGSKGKGPVAQSPVYGRDEDGKNVLYAYTGTKVVYDLGISKAQGTMTAWANISRGGTGSRIIISNEGTNQNLFNVYVDVQNKLNLAVINNSNLFVNIITAEEELIPGQWYFVAVSWVWIGTALNCALYLNSNRYSKEWNNAVTDFKDFTGAKTAIGSNISGEYILKGLVKRFSYASRELTEPEILKMYHGSRIKYEYNASLGRLEKKIVSIGLQSFETYYGYIGGNKAYSTTNILYSIQNQSNPINYEHDGNGNITRISEPGKDIQYSYNELNELIREDNQVINKTIVYTYDVGGNIKTKIERAYKSESGGTTITYGYDSVWKDELVNYNGKTITYDLIGNPLTYNNYIYTWEEGRQLKSIVGNSKNISFKYNDIGIRTEKNSGGLISKYYLIGNKVTIEDNGIDRIYYTYDSNNDLVSMNLNGQEYYYIRNGQGDIIGLFDNTATQIVTYVYDTWGKLISITDANGVDVTNNTGHVGYKNPYRYRGYRYDSETGLYYLNSRYYNPEWGRYLNADASAGSTGLLLSHNVFAYAMNNPANMVDPNGYLADFIWGNQDDEPSVDVITSAAPVIPKPSFIQQSGKKAAVSDRIDKAGEVAGGMLIKKSNTLVTYYGTIKIQQYVSKPGLIGKGALGILGKAGTIGFAANDLIKDFQGKKYFSAGVDATSALVGVYTGAQIAAGGAIAISSLGLVGLPAIVVGGVAFLVSVGVSVFIDYGSNLAKEAHYGRK